MHRPLNINVVFVYVADLELARRFYEDIVGLGTPRVSNHEWIEYELPGGANFALHRTSADCVQGVDRRRNTVAFSFVVDDLDAAHEHLLDHNTEIVRPPEHGVSFRLMEFLDPEGNPLRFIQRD